MEFFNSLNLTQIKGGTKLKQGDLGSVLSYSLTDENGQEITSFNNKTAYINLVLDDKIWFTTTTLVDISRVTFRIDKAIPIGLYYLEIKIDDYIFPSDRDSIILIEEGSTPYDLKELVPNYNINMTLKGILSDLSQKGIDISDLNRRIGNVNAELIASRNGKSNLKTRIDDLENKTTEQLAQKANKDEVTNVMTPKGTLAYASLPTSGNQVGWYYYCPDGDGTHGAGNYVWNGTSWFFGGTGDEGYNLLKKDLAQLSEEIEKIMFDVPILEEVNNHFINASGIESSENTNYLYLVLDVSNLINNYVDITAYTNGSASVALWDENKSPIRVFKISSTESSTYEVFVESNAKYIAVSCDKRYRETFCATVKNIYSHMMVKIKTQIKSLNKITGIYADCDNYPIGSYINFVPDISAAVANLPVGFTSGGILTLGIDDTSNTYLQIAFIRVAGRFAYRYRWGANWLAWNYFYNSSDVDKLVKDVKKLVDDVGKKTNNPIMNHFETLFSKVVCIGDSLTRGYQAHYAEGERNRDYGYPEFLARLTHLETANYGNSGATPSSWFAR